MPDIHACQPCWLFPGQGTCVLCGYEAQVGICFPSWRIMTGFLCVMTVLQKFMGESVMSVNIADLSLSSVRGCSAASAEHGPAGRMDWPVPALPAMEGVLLPEEAIAG